jgi:hypothetical protein
MTFHTSPDSSASFRNPKRYEMTLVDDGSI